MHGESGFFFLMGRHQVRILILGLDNAGKTTILYRLHQVIYHYSMHLRTQSARAYVNTCVYRHVCANGVVLGRPCSVMLAGEDSRAIFAQVWVVHAGWWRLGAWLHMRQQQQSHEYAGAAGAFGAAFGAHSTNWC